MMWSGHLTGNRTYDGMTVSVDLFATMADILGRKNTIPENAAEDSFSFFEVLTGNQTDKPTRPFTIHHSINGSFAIRKGPWKLALRALCDFWAI